MTRKFPSGWRAVLARITLAILPDPPAEHTPSLARITIVEGRR